MPFFSICVVVNNIFLLNVSAVQQSVVSQLKLIVFSWDSLCFRPICVIDAYCDIKSLSLFLNTLLYLSNLETTSFFVLPQYSVNFIDDCDTNKVTIITSDAQMR